MKLEIYTIYDSKEEIYYQPFYFMNKQVALRQFGEMANDPKSKVYKFPADHTIWHLGSYEDSSATITPLKTKKCLAHGTDAVTWTKEEQEQLAAARQDIIDKVKTA